MTLLTEVDYRTGRTHDMAGTDRAGPCGGRAGDLGPRPFGRGAAGRSCRLRTPISRSAAPTNISIAAPAARPSSMSRPRHADTRAPGPVRLAWPRGALRLRSRLPPRRGDRADARRHAADPATRRARGGARHLGHGRHGRPARPLARAGRPLHRRGRGRLPRPDPCLARATGAGAAARSASATPRAMRSCRR